MTVQLTPQQQSCLDTSQNLVVTAGAGSGKTTVLTQRYLRLLIDERYPVTQIVAITFTRKAAASMRRKVRSAVRARLAAPGISDDLRSSLRAAYTHFDEARISTIHALCESILRRYSLAAGLEPDFAVDETGLRPDPERDHIRQQLERMARTRDERLVRLAEWFPRDAVEQTIERLATEEDLLVTFEPLVHLRRQEALDRIWDHRERLSTYLAAPLPPVSEEIEKRSLQAIRDLVALAVAVKPARIQRKRYVSFDDLQRHTLNLLRCPSALHIRQQLAEGIRAILVDEFQDTNDQQWEIIVRLAGATPDDILPPRKLFLVGDQKQSIYRFRDADVTVMTRAMNAIHQSHVHHGGTAAVGSQGRIGVVSLEDNFRSDRQLLDVLNPLFDRLLDVRRKRMFDAPAQPLAACRDAPSLANSLEIHLGGGISDYSVCRAAARRIRELVASREPVYSARSNFTRLEPITYRDVAILHRSHAYASFIEDGLEDEEVPYLVEGGRGFFNTPEVRDLRTFLRVLQGACDEVTELAFLRGPLVGLSDEALLQARLCRPRGRLLQGVSALGVERGALWRDLCEEDQEALAGLHEHWRRWQHRVDRVCASELVGRALEESGALAPFRFGSRGRQRVENIYKFVELLHDMSRSGLKSLRDTVDWVEKVAAEAAREGEANIAEQVENAVRVMTLHAAKGLEFPVVVMMQLRQRGGVYHSAPIGIRRVFPDDSPLELMAMQFPDPSSGRLRRNLWAEAMAELERAETEAERRRLFYVGATRSRHRLLLFDRLSITRDGRLHKNLRDTPLDWLLKGLGLDPAQLERGAAAPFGDVPIRTIQEVLQPCVLEPSGSDVSDGEEARTTSRSTTRIEPAVVPSPEPSYGPRSAPAVGVTTLLQALKLVPDADLQAKEEAGWLEGLQAQPRAAIRGTVVHAVLERDPWMNWSRAHPLVETLLRAHGVADPVALTSELQTVKSILEDLQALPEFESLLAADEVHNELPFELPIGSLIVRGTMDRLQRVGSRWRILDYKTGRPPIPRMRKQTRSSATPQLSLPIGNDEAAEAVDDRLSSYETQLQIYALAVHRILGVPFRDIGAALVFVEGFVCVPVKVEARTVGQLERTIAALDRQTLNLVR